MVSEKWREVKTAVIRFLFSVFCFSLISCGTAVPAPIPTAIIKTQPTIQPTPTPIPVETQNLASLPSPTPSPPPTITPIPDTGWLTLQAGLERRTIRLFDENGQQSEHLYLLRLDPAQFTFEIAYSSGQPKSLPTWQAETGAQIVVNGGFFTEDFVATGLVVVDGAASGVSYGEFAGMFAVTDAGPDVRWLAERPFSSSEPLQFALQSFPMLVRPGGEMGFSDEDGRQARRTVVAEDENGRILFILAPFGSFTLHEMSRYLVESDLEIDAALNLDGGTSTGLVLAEPEERVLAFTAVPTVIVVYPR
ncbi:MAG: phosphodiester glycosidase family protein [Chloroflexi bacterium]|nr:MAG: phosphodiester glycosidase family protein [Chloroflexota bacterium]